MYLKNLYGVGPRERQKGADRFRKLADYLETLDVKRFNLSSWASINRKESEKLNNERDAKAAVEKNLCGTTACAFGHAATMPEFRKLGLWLRPTEVINWRGSHFAFEVIYETRKGDRFEGTDAAQWFFYITEDEVQQIFFPDSYKVANRDAVVQRLRAQSEKMELEISIDKLTKKNRLGHAPAQDLQAMWPEP